MILFTCLLADIGCNIARPESHVEVTVLTYNIHHGAGMDGKIDLAHIAKVIAPVNLIWLRFRKLT